MKIVGLIPARGGSKGIPKKNLSLINNKPLIDYSMINLCQSKYIHSVYLSSDSDEILSYGNKFHLDHINFSYAPCKTIKRKDELSNDLASTDDVLYDFVKNLTFHVDAVILYQPTSPMVIPEDIDNGIKTFIENDYDSLFSGVKTNDMLVWKEQYLCSCHGDLYPNYVHPINYDYKNRGRRQDRRDSELIIESGSFYITKKETILKEKCRLGGRIGYSLIPYWRSFEIDSLEDLEMIRKLMEK